MATKQFKQGWGITILTDSNGKDYITDGDIDSKAPYTKNPEKEEIELEESKWEVIQEFELTIEDGVYVVDDNDFVYEGYVGTRPSNIFIRRK